MMTLNGEVYKFTQPQGDQLWLVISPKHRQELLTFEGYGFVYIKMETLIYFSAYLGYFVWCQKFNLSNIFIFIKPTWLLYFLWQYHEMFKVLRWNTRTIPAIWIALTSPEIKNL